MTTAAGPYQTAVKLLDHHETMANRDTWHGDDREAYLTRTLLHAQAFATLAVARELQDVCKALYAGRV